MNVSKNLMLLAACVLFTFVCASKSKADWDRDSDNTFDMILTLDTGNDVDRTELDITREGNEIVFTIREYVNGVLVDEDDFDRWLGNDIYFVKVIGGRKVDDIYVDPELFDDTHIRIYGGEGDDIIDGGRLAYGGPGDDKLYNAFELVGDDDNDKLVAGPLTAGMRGGDGDDSLDGRLAKRWLLILGDDGDDFIRGSEYDDDIRGYSGNDTIFGYGGDDTIRGDGRSWEEQGNDWIFGGDGNDTIYGGGGSDLLYGEGDNDTLRGENGVDTLIGGSGADRLYPGAYEGYTEALYGSTGADVFFVPVNLGYYYNDYKWNQSDFVFFWPNDLQ